MIPHVIYVLSERAFFEGILEYYCQGSPYS